MENPTMTLHECCEAFRANLIPMPEDKLADTIEHGGFMDFAMCLKGGAKRSFLIFRKPFYEWLEPKISAPVVRI